MLSQIENRRSIRKYNSQEVDKEKILQIIDSARLSPSGSNTQPWNFIIVTSESMKEKITTVDHNQRWMMSAPVFIVCVADIRSRITSDILINLDENSPEPELKQIIRDTAIAIEHMCLQAEQLGLSTCWTAWFNQNDIRPVLGIPEDKYVCCVLTLGYANEQPEQRPRKPLNEIIRYEKW